MVQTFGTDRLLFNRYVECVPRYGHWLSHGPRNIPYRELSQEITAYLVTFR
jgi:hypothetical protein